MITTTVELMLFMWAVSATTLWLVERLPEPEVKARVAKTSDTDPRGAKIRGE